VAVCSVAICTGLRTFQVDKERICQLHNHYHTSLTMVQLRKLLHDLPFSLFLTSLLLITSALPALSTESPGLRQPLTPENFNSTIKNGLWFVEYFSTYCGHCRQFAPTWEKLANSADDHKGVEMAQVNCMMSGGT
jgi:thiol-disulfide isomerase/thioredoxin